MPTSKDRPGHRDDDHIWLLQKLAGILHDQGKGTDISTLPRGVPASDVVHYIRGTHTDVDDSEETVLQLPNTTRSWALVAMTYHRTGGAGATVEPRVGQVATFAAGGPDDRVALGPQAVADGINAAFCAPIQCRTDTSFRLYFRPGFDTGTDNAGTYQFWFKQGIETVESTP